MEGNSTSPKPLSERPIGYVLATLGGLLGAPLGIVASPFVLFLVNKNMKGKDGKQPNRFLRWALLGIIGAPLCLAVSNPAFQEGHNKGSNSATNSSTSQSQENSSGPQATSDPTSAEAKDPTSITVGDFTLSGVKVERYSGDTHGADVAGELWAVYANVTNNSNETKVPSHNMTTEVKDSRGRTFKTADFVITSNSIMNESFGGAKITRFSDGILPGSTRNNIQVGIYDVTPGAKDLKLCAAGIFSERTCISGS